MAKISYYRLTTHISLECESERGWLSPIYIEGLFYLIIYGSLKCRIINWYLPAVFNDDSFQPQDSQQISTIKN